MPPRLLDANPLVHFLTRNDEAKAERAKAILDRVERGSERVLVPPLVMFETIFTLQRHFRATRQQIAASIRPIVELRGLELEDKDIWIEALELYGKQGIAFTDAYNAAYMRARGVSEIYSWDVHFDKIEGVTRIEP